MTTATRTTIPELASLLRPALLRLTRIVRNQRVDLSVTLTQLSAMWTLEKRGPMSAGELANFERVQPPSMTKVLANLEEEAGQRTAALAVNFEFGFMKSETYIRINKGVLVIVLFNSFLDGSGRSNYVTREFFYRAD